MNHGEIRLAQFSVSQAFLRVIHDHKTEVPLEDPSEGFTGISENIAVNSRYIWRANSHASLLSDGRPAMSNALYGSFCMGLSEHSGWVDMKPALKSRTEK